MEKPPPTDEPSMTVESHDTDRGDAAADAALVEDPRALQILSTEHWSLLSARSLAYNESFTRANMFLTFVAMSFVALGLLVQATGFDTTFLWVAALVLGIDLLIGTITMTRMILAGLEDARATQGMNRIRNAYARIAPTIERFFVTGMTDDFDGMLKTMTLGKREPGGLASVVSSSGTMVGLITAIIGGTFAATIALALGVAVGVALAIGIVATLAFLAGIMAWGISYLRREQATFESRFPTTPNSTGTPPA